MSIVKKKKIENVKVSAKNTEPFPKKKNTKSVNMHVKKNRDLFKEQKERKASICTRTINKFF